MEQKYDPTFKYPREPRAHPQGGIHLTESAAKVKEVGLSLLKTMGVKIKEGGVFDLLKISRPAAISNYVTFLQCVGKDYVNTDFLNRAATTTDPLERLKLVVAFIVSGILHNPADLQNNGPLNPVLGETYIAEKKDGTTLYGEQISHHPPIMAFLVVGPKRSYKLYGTGEFDVKLNGFNNIIGKRIGKSTIEFADGGKIVFTNPETRIDGLLVGDRRYHFIKTMVFLDKRNKLSAELTFLYENTGAISKITSSIKGLFGAKEEKPSQDNFEVVFFKIEKAGEDTKKEVLAEGSGSWVSYFQIDNRLWWRVDQSFNDPWIEDIQSKKRLPSDSAFREDAKYIKIKDFDKAQKEKDNLENKQRNDAKLRKEYQEKNKVAKN